MQKLIHRLAAFAALTTLTTLCRADVIYVNASHPSNGDGQSWKSPFDNLHSALAAANAGDQIWVAAGTYAPAGPGGDRASTFQLVSGVAIYGGFAGGETQLEERNPKANPVIFTGDLNGDDIGAPNDPSHADNSYHVTRAIGTLAGTRVDGVTITAGNANGSFPHNAGGGCLIEAGMVDFANCEFSNHFAVSGGGLLANSGSTATASHCRFAGNMAGSGGGIFGTHASVTVSDCEFVGNSSSTFLLGGGGIYLQFGSSHIENCAFVRNVAYSEGGGARVLESQTTMNSCVFHENSAEIGGGVLSFESVGISDCTFSNNHAANLGGGAAVILGGPVINCRFVGNSCDLLGGAIYEQQHVQGLINCVMTGNSSAYGGAVYARAFGPGFQPARMFNCTVAGNTATVLGGGVHSEEASSTEIFNSIIWDNQDSLGSGESSQLAVALPTIRYSCVQGWTGSLGGVGNFGSDPLFVDLEGRDDILGTEDDNARLGSGSPCFNRSDPQSVVQHATDPDGADRRQECIMDVGAYEAVSIPAMGDCNANNSLDSCDIAMAASLDCNLNVIPDECETVPEEGIILGDNCSGAPIVQSGATLFTTVCATTDGPAEPDGCGFGDSDQMTHDVWFRYLAACTGSVTIDLCDSSFDARVAVYVGCPTLPGTVIACSDNDCGMAPRVTFPNAGPTLYRIRIGGKDDAVGAGVMQISCTPAPVCPADIAPPGAPDGQVNIDDLLLVINNWGANGSGIRGDVDGSGSVDIDDLLAIVNAWGQCG